MPLFSKQNSRPLAPPAKTGPVPGRARGNLSSGPRTRIASLFEDLTGDKPIDAACAKTFPLESGAQKILNSHQRLLGYVNL